jgi:prephenate dehydratase
MPQPDVFYLGPRGTYSHLVAEKRFGPRARLTPLPTILEVCRHVARHPRARGVVPIENSSGGVIHETVDILLAHRPRVAVEEELTLNVTLALLGRRGERPRLLCSHFAPLEHCDSWIRRHLPRVERRVVTSTAVAALAAASECGTLALGNRRLAQMYGLEVLAYPVQSDVPNVTSFIVVRPGGAVAAAGDKTTLAARIPNRPGSLCTLLETFRDRNVNLCRIVSRPLRGSPKEYAFLIDVEGGRQLPRVRQALAAARRICTHLRIAGSYPCRAAYGS